MKQRMPPISVVIPTLNERDNIIPLFKRIKATLSSAAIPFEIVVLDDHSTDGTAEIVARLGRPYNARLISKRGKPGKAFSLLEGFAAANHSLLCMIDGDLQYPPEDIKLMYHKMQYLDADIVITERMHQQTSFLRRLSSKVFNLVFARLLFGIKYDTQSGLKLFHKDVLQRIQIAPSQWTFDLEFIVRALEQNFKIVSHKILFSERPSGEAKVKLFSATFEMARGSLHLWRHSSSRRIKLNYKSMEVLQNRVLLVVGGLLLAGTLLLTQPANAAALSSSNVPILTGIGQAIPTAVTPSSGSTTPVSTPATTTTSIPTATTPVATTAGSSSQTANAALLGVTMTTVASLTPAATTANITSPTVSSDSSMADASSLEDSGTLLAVAIADSPATTDALATATPASATPTTSSTTPTDQTGKVAAYYKASTLNSRTSTILHNLALLVIYAGGACIANGMLLVIKKSLTKRKGQQQVLETES